MPFRVITKIWGGVQKYHPECKFFIENVVFDDMKEDWAEVCDALRKPIIVCSDKISHTKRNCAYWTNIAVPDTWCNGLRPRDPDTCMDPGRTVQTYPAFGKNCVRPLGASWTDDPEGPRSNLYWQMIRPRMRHSTYDPMKQISSWGWMQAPQRGLASRPRID